jgi:hypothetical protein
MELQSFPVLPLRRQIFAPVLDWFWRRWSQRELPLSMEHSTLIVGTLSSQNNFARSAQM